MQEQQAARPVDGLGDRRLFFQIELAHRVHEGDELAAQAVVQVRNASGENALFEFDTREGDVQMQAAALQGIRKLARVVAGQKHQRRGARHNGADLRDGHLVVGENLQQQGFELGVGLVDLVDQQHRAFALLHGFKQRSGFEELRRIEHVADAVQAGHGFGQALRALKYIAQLFLEHLGVQQLFAVLPLVQGFGLVQALVALQAQQGQVQQPGGGLGQLRLADPRRTLDQHGFAQPDGQKHRGGNARTTDIAELRKAAFDGFDGAELHALLHGLCVLRALGGRCEISRRWRS